MIIFDATNLKVGRLCTVVAKSALKGENIKIINAEKAVFTGNKNNIILKYRNQHERGRQTKGPFQPRMPDRFLRRIIRGMLPYKTTRGSEALKRIMVYMGNPEELKGTTIPEANIETSHTLRFITVEEVCKELGGRI